MILGPLLQTLGARVLMKGDVTTNTWAGARSARTLEESLGYNRGRLDNGWSLLVLKQQLHPDDFQFSGITLRSGGRLGLPKQDSTLDSYRPRVNDQIAAERSSEDYAKWRNTEARKIPATGPGRLVKIAPATRHSSTMAPSDQYPMGGGGLQWTLVRECEFMVAMVVDRFWIARIPGFAVNLRDGMAYDDRAKLARYLDNA